MHRFFDITLHSIIASELSQANPDTPVPDVEDALQHACERFLKLDLRIEVLSPKDWLFTVATNYLRDIRKSQRKTISAETILLANPTEEECHHEREGNEILQVLKEQDMTAYITAWLRVEHEADFEMIAKFLTTQGHSISAEALRKRYSRSNRRFVLRLCRQYLITKMKAKDHETSFRSNAHERGTALRAWWFCAMYDSARLSL